MIGGIFNAQVAIAVSYVIAFGALFLPGYFLIFLYWQELIHKLTFQKLLALAIAISAPVVAVGCYLTWFVERLRWAGKEDEMTNIFGASVCNGSLMALFSFYAAILFCFVFNINVHKRKKLFLFLLGAFMAIVYGIYWINWKLGTQN